MPIVAGGNDSHKGRPISGGQATVYRSYAHDAQGSITGLEGQQGQLPDDRTYDYDPYGDLEDPDPSNSDEAEDELAPAAQENPFRFQGHYYDSAIKTYDMHARSYRPEAGRFLSEDRYQAAGADIALQTDPLTQNRYAFAGGNPVTNIEFDGHLCGYLGTKCDPEKVERSQRQLERMGLAGDPSGGGGGGGSTEGGTDAGTAQTEAGSAAPQIEERAARKVAREVTIGYCASLGSPRSAVTDGDGERGACSEDHYNENIDTLTDALLGGDDLAEVELERREGSIGVLDIENPIALPANLLGGGALLQAGKKGLIKLGEAGLRVGVVGSLRQGGTQGIKDALDVAIVQSVARFHARRVGLTSLSPKQLDAIGRTPRLAAPFLGRKVHDRTATTLSRYFSGRIGVNHPRAGVDFATRSGSRIDLTTPGAVTRHQAKGGSYKDALYATYRLRSP